LPKGPRTESASPTAAAQIAPVAIPTDLTVCSMTPSSSGSPLIEIGTSPAPPAEIIVNWPGRKRLALPSGTCRRSVHVSAVSRRRSRTR
jgi:hypothetical protein